MPAFRIAPRTGPSASVVHAVHDRYLLEVVEGLGLCPFARKSRELARVHRPLFWTDEGPVPAPLAATTLAETHHRHPDSEIVLLTFVDRPGHYADPRVFDAFCAEIREAYGQLGAAEYFMVAFHPRSGTDHPTDRPLTKDSLVPLLRRSPDPVIQCVNAEVLSRVRVQAQRAAKKRMLEAVGDRDPRLRALLENSIQTDSELSAEIARHNFDTVADGRGRAQLEAMVEAIHRDRALRYGF